MSSIVHICSMSDINFISGDYDLLCHFRGAHPDNRLIIMTEEDLVTLGVEDRPLRELDPKEDRLYDLAYDEDEKLIGALTYFLADRDGGGEGADTVRICQVSTRDGYANQGVASTLISRAFQRAQEKDLDLSITSFTGLGKERIAKVCARMHNECPQLNVFYDNLSSFGKNEAVTGGKPYRLNFEDIKASIEYV